MSKAKPDPAGKDDLDRIVGLSLDLMRSIRWKMCAHDQEQGVNMLQLHALVMISDQEGMTMKELADAMRITSPSATSFVQRLVRLKWLERRHDRRNRRVVRLRVTPTGRKIVTKMMHQRKETMREMFSFLSAADRKAYLRILQRLSSTLRSH